MLATISVKRFIESEDGATAVEYGLIAAMVSIAAISALQQLGVSLTQIFTYVAGVLATAVPGSGATP